MSAPGWTRSTWLTSANGTNTTPGALDTVARPTVESPGHDAQRSADRADRRCARPRHRVAVRSRRGHRLAPARVSLCCCAAQHRPPRDLRGRRDRDHRRSRRGPVVRAAGRRRARRPKRQRLRVRLHRDRGQGHGTAARSMSRVRPGTLFRVFAWTGLTSLGGGRSAYLYEALVLGRRWVRNDEFVQDLTLSQLLPGPNFTNLAVALGMRLGGWWGAAWGAVALILP